MHLVVFVHGYVGAGSDFDNMERAFLSESSRLRPSEPLLTLKANCNSTLAKTSDGIERGAIRIWKEVMAYLSKSPEVSSLSLVSHSLGGLYARYLCRLLNDSFVFDKLTPRFFVTFASPHLSVRRPLLRSPVNFAFQSIGQHLCQSTKELFLEDSNKILLEMTRDSFLEPLKKFQSRILYANVFNDMQVHYSTASISTRNPYRSSNSTSQAMLQRSRDFPSLTQYSLHAVQERLNHSHNTGDDAFTNDPFAEPLKTMFLRLNSLEWERYDCVFATVFAHEQIMGKRRIFAGDDVTKHLISRVFSNPADEPTLLPLSEL